MELTANDFDEVLEVIEKIGDRQYSIQELALMGSPAEALAVFDGIPIVNGRNILQALALYVGADLWRTYDFVTDFQIHRMKIGIRKHIKQASQ